MKRILWTAMMAVSVLLLSSFALPDPDRPVVNPFGVTDPHVPTPYIKFSEDGTVLFADSVQFCQ
ncbi:hypothetical protein [Paenibacillus turpanensis]|uniref:hypothetical protein n=1 Tax=Paenibacillus turpanensis TaxID=2689078 RepID=UPI00140A22F3|nr:hypothetical protein [Paenibacillus turpanensis]